jgi:hypothetical protein
MQKYFCLGQKCNAVTCGMQGIWRSFADHSSSARYTNRKRAKCVKTTPSHKSPLHQPYPSAARQGSTKYDQHHDTRPYQDERMLAQVARAPYSAIHPDGDTAQRSDVFGYPLPLRLGPRHQ